VAWDCEREDFRTFRVDRVTDVPSFSGQRFVPRQVPGGDLSAFVSRSVATSPYTFQAEVVIFAPYEEISQRISPLAGRLERVDDGTCRLLTGGNQLGALAIYIAALRADFEVVKPDELIAELTPLAKRLLRAARKSAARSKKTEPNG